MADEVVPATQSNTDRRAQHQSHPVPALAEAYRQKYTRYSPPRKRGRVQQDVYVEFMLHSSELMPGGSPTFKDAQSIESLYADLETLFSMVSDRMIGCTLSEYQDWHTANS